MIREPVVAGQFYPLKPADLSGWLDSAMEIGNEKKRAIGVVAPHAGYFYSGDIAAKLFSSVKIPEKVILLGPNHTGQGARASVFPEGMWRTPLGLVEVDGKLSEAIEKSSPLFSFDYLAHSREHSLEVLLPFLQRTNPKVKIAPVTFMLRSVTEMREAGEALARVIRESPEEILMVVSSDMTHYESQDSAIMKDSRAIERIRDVDPEGLIEVVHDLNISMCGAIPAAVMLFAARSLGARGGDLVDYATSGRKSGDLTHVVGYAALTVN